MAKDRNRSDWMKAARFALLNGGVGAVRVERLARTLQVTKGSFYWHFKDRNELLQALLVEWEQEKSILRDVVGQRNLRHALTNFFTELQRRITVSERGEWPSDAAIFTWAAVSPNVARRVKKEEQARVQLLERICRNKAAAEFIYMAYIGFLLRRRRVPQTVKNFPIFADISIAIILKLSRSTTRKGKVNFPEVK
jgi:AcrR family transcriptional regulator